MLSVEGVIEAVERATASEPFAVVLDGRWSLNEPLKPAVDNWEV